MHLFQVLQMQGSPVWLGNNSGSDFESCATHTKYINRTQRITWKR